MKQATALLLIACLALASVRIISTDTEFGHCINEINLIFNCSGLELLDIPNHEHIPNYMETVDLSNNRIQNVSYLDYDNLSQTLSKMLLQSNQISIINKNSFELLVNLVFLDLSKNLIQGNTLDEFMFNDLRKLKTLKLQHNPLRVIKKDTFNFMELPAIEYLDISHGEITEIEKGGLDLPSLKELDLSWNRLETIDEDSFRMMNSLHVLDMSHNNLHVLNTLPLLQEIRTLIFDNNDIEQVLIKDTVWQWADSLVKLSLRNNKVMRFTKDSLPFDLETLTEIDLYNNEIQCDCRMKWFADKEFDFKGKNITIQCRYPTKFEGHNLIEIPSEDLKCGIPLAQILIFAALVTLALLCCMGLSVLLVKRRKRRKMKSKPYRKDSGGDYAAVYTKDDDEVRVAISDNKTLLNEDREFDV